MRMLLITGAHLFTDQKLRRLILRRIRWAMRRGEVHTCMIHPAPVRPSSSEAEDGRWEVLVSYLSQPPLRALHG